MPAEPRSVGLIVGKFAPPHKGHQYLIETALQDQGISDLIILVYSNPDFPQMPSWLRARWLQQLYPQAQVLVPANPPPNQADDHTQREFVKQWLAQHSHLLPAPVSWVYTSESYGEGFARHIAAQHRLVDIKRRAHPVSGTQVRALWEAWAATVRPKEGGLTQSHQGLLAELSQVLSQPVLRHLIKLGDPVHRLAFLGAESTGKSTLTLRVAQELGVPMVGEYGRTHYEQKGGSLELEDYLYIAQHHRRLEDAAVMKAYALAGRGLLKGQPYIAVDTNALTTLFFSYYYNQCGLPELHQLATECEQRYHHVFVCADDIPFEQDGWRDNEVWRGRMQGLVLHDLDSRGIVYTMVRGSLEERVEQVKKVLRGELLEARTASKQLGPRGS